MTEANRKKWAQDLTNPAYDKYRNEFADSTTELTDGKPDKNWSVADIKAYLKENKIEYDSKARSKADLLKALEPVEQELKE